MNYLPYVTLVGWETRNWRHRDRALVWCKDYGFTPVTKHVFVGEMYAKERTEMRKKFESLFTKKTEKFFFATMCKSCFTDLHTYSQQRTLCDESKRRVTHKAIHRIAFFYTRKPRTVEAP